MMSQGNNLSVSSSLLLPRYETHCIMTKLCPVGQIIDLIPIYRM